MLSGWCVLGVVTQLALDQDIETEERQPSERERHIAPTSTKETQRHLRYNSATALMKSTANSPEKFLNVEESVGLYRYHRVMTKAHLRLWDKTSDTTTFPACTKYCALETSPDAAGTLYVPDIGPDWENSSSFLML